MYSLPLKLSVLLFCVGFEGWVVALSPQRTTFVLKFIPRPPKVPRARSLGGISKSLEEFTLCQWIQPLGTSKIYNTIFNYDTSEYINELLSVINIRRNEVMLYIHNQAMAFTYPLPLDQWQHICYTWSSFTGNLVLYMNGNKTSTRRNIANGTAIGGDGDIAYGNDQGSKGSGWYSNDYVAYGKITEVHLWDHILCDAKIHHLSKCGSSIEGNILAWGKTEMNLTDADLGTDDDICGICDDDRELLTPM